MVLSGTFGGVLHFEGCEKVESCICSVLLLCWPCGCSLASLLNDSSDAVFGCVTGAVVKKREDEESREA